MAETIHKSLTSLRDFVDLIDERGLLRHVDGADPDYEIGALTEIGARVDNPKPILFDDLPGYDRGYRVLTLPYVTDQLHAIALGMNEAGSSVELVREWKDDILGVERREPNEVRSGPVQEHVFEGDEVDVFRLPCPIWHEKDGGPFIGTGNAVITRGPADDDEWSWVNMGVYRNQVHDGQTLGIFVNQTNQGYKQLERWWERGEHAPIAIDLGPGPHVYAGACMKMPKGYPELEIAGGLKGEPIDVIVDDDTGLPIPAHSEMTVIGHVPPPEEETRPEGPFGECFGYYAGGAGMEEERVIIKVDKLWHRDDPILKGCPELKDQAHVHALGAHLGTSARAWSTIEDNVSNVEGVYSLFQGCQQGSSVLVVSIRQEYAGHAKQAGLAALSAQNAITSNMMTVVVDDDIDPSDTEDVLFALTTRCTPHEDVDVIRDVPTFELDPRTPPEDRASGNFTTSALLVDACIPYHWRDEFPDVVDFDPDYKADLEAKFDVAEWD